MKTHVRNMKEFGKVFLVVCKLRRTPVAISISFAILLGLFSIGLSQAKVDGGLPDNEKDFFAPPNGIMVVGATMYACDDANNLLTFNSATPGTIASNVLITGLASGEKVDGLDVRPSTGELYALGIKDDGATRTGRIYTISPATAVATAVGAPFSTALADVSNWGFDFDPVTDQIRVINSNGGNLRVNPNSGALAGTDTNLSVTGIEAIAYDRNSGSGLTTLYAYNFSVDQLATIGGIDGTPSPDGGVVTNVGSSTLFAFGPQGMDIEAGTNVARFSAKVGGVFNLYTINLTTGGATLVGAIGSGATIISGLTTKVSITKTMYACDDSNNLLTFDAATPDTIATNVLITGLAAGEKVDGLDVRPATGQLYALGIKDDGATRTGRIYTINPATAVAAAVGSPFSAALADVSNWGFDFDPVTDQIRVINSNGGNLRVNPNSGALTSTDTNLSVTGIEAIAYDRNGGSGLTTLYAYNFSVDQLATIGGIDGTPSPDGGVVANVGSTGLFAFGPQALDIESGTNVARLSAKVGGVFNLYTINLTIGGATLVGAIGTGTTPITGLTTAPSSTILNLIGTSGSDNMNLVRSGANIVATGVVGGPVTVPLGGLTGVVVSGLDGGDLLTVDYSGGNFAIPITYHGGNPITNPGDRLRTVGGNFATGASNPINGHDGALVYTGGTTGAATINYTGLEPIDDLNVVTNYVINGTNGLNFLNIINGPVVLGTQTTQVNDGAVLFELINFANKTNVTVNALDGSDQIAVNNSLKGVGLASLIVNGENGSDQFNINGPGIVAGVAYTFNGGNDNELFSVSGGLLPGPITINGDAHTGGTPSTADRLTVNSFTSNVTQSGNQLLFSGGSAINFGTLEKIDLNSLNTLSVTGSAAVDTVVLSKTSPTTYRSILNGGIELNFDSPIAAVGGQYFANVADGSDTLTVDNTGRVVNLRVAYNAGAGTNDVLNVFGNPGAAVARESYITGASQDQGRFVLDPNGNMGYLKTSVTAPSGDELDVSFNGLDPINTDVPSAIFDVTLSAAADNAALLSDGVLLNGFQSMLLNDVGGTFETTRFANKATTTISGFLANDTISWTHNGILAAGLTNLEVNGFLPVGLGVDDAPGSAVNRDLVFLIDVLPGVRNITIDYSDTPSIVDVTGLNVPVHIGTAETLTYAGDAVNNDLATIIDKTSAAEPARVFNLAANGAKYMRNGGVGGSDVGPDVILNGLSGTGTSLTLDGDDPTVLPGDRLDHDGPLTAILTPTGPNAGDITAPGIIGVHFQNYERVFTARDTITTLGSSPSTTTYGQLVTFTATVTTAIPGNGTPTGAVNFLDGGVPIPTCQGVTLNGAGDATCAVADLGAGVNKVISAVYSGSVNFNTSTGTTTQTINKANTTTVVTSSANPSVFGQNVGFTATVTAVAPGAGTPTGTVTFIVDGVSQPPAALSGGSVTLNTSTLSIGNAHTITAQYSGDANFIISNGALPGVQVVNKANTTTVITNAAALGTASNSGQPYAVNWTVAPVAPGGGIPTGFVSVTDGTDTCLAAVALGTCNLTSTSPGVKTIIATYLGDANFNGSTSPGVPHTVLVTISGNVQQYNAPNPNTNLPGVTVTLTGTGQPVGGTSVVTDAGGNFSFAGLANGGNFVVTPSGLGDTYEPLFRAYANLTLNVSNSNFVAYTAAGGVPRIIKVVNAYATPGQPVVVPVNMIFLGNDAAMQFSLSFDVNQISTPVVSCGTSDPGCTIVTDNSQPGKVGIAITPATQLAAGPRNIANVTFQTFAIEPPNSLVAFSNTPTAISVRDAGFNLLPFTLQTGFVVFARGFEGDVAPRPNGSGEVDSSDIVGVARFVAGIDNPVLLNTNEFQRADCAPNGLKGDGAIDSTDIVQTTRYGAGLDGGKNVGFGGPMQALPLPPVLTRAERSDENGETAKARRTMRVVSTTAAPGTDVEVSVDLDSRGDEVASSFTLNFDPARLRISDATSPDVNPDVSVGAEAPAGTGIAVNATDAARGQIGIVLFNSSLIPFSNATGRKVVTLHFRIAEDALTGPSPITFGDTEDSPTQRSMSDGNAKPLTAAYTDGEVNIVGTNAAGATLRGRVTTAEGQGIRGATIVISGNSMGQPVTVVTGSLGIFRADNLRAGETYTVTVTSKRYRFTNPKREITLADNFQDIDFMADQ